MRTGECGQCGKCCQYIQLPLARPLGPDETRWVELHEGITVAGESIRIDTPCSAYDGLCTIYENRPTICRQYPTQDLDEGCAYSFE